jgi:hyperosmotically inducible periplasmic protein
MWLASMQLIKTGENPSADSEGGSMRTKTGIVLAVALAALSMVGCESRPAYTESNAQAVSDSTITANVRSALVQDPVTRSRNISVNTVRGTVELNGFVDSMQERHEAARIARDVPGVQFVDNKLQVTSGGPVVGGIADDRTISSEVRSALASNPETQSSRIEVTTSNGVVQLAGFVDSNEQRAAAGNVASSVEGVRRVDNDLRLNPPD